MVLKIALVAGEASGDLLGASLMHELKQQYAGEISFIGVGGDRMQQEGFKSVFPMKALSIGGYGLDVLFAIPKIYLYYLRLIKQILRFKPDVFIGIDAPDFNFYVEHKLHKNGIKIVHYISPTIWAWRYERIYKIKQFVDLMLCIFPMEEEIYHRENIAAKFIGHYIANSIDFNINTLASQKMLSIPSDRYVVGVLIGSRKAEIKRLAPVFIHACNLIAQHIPNVYFVFPLLNQDTASLFASILQTNQLIPEHKCVVDQTRNAIMASDLVIAKSGTVTLEVALCKKPLIISYKVGKLTERIIRKKITIKYVGQPNILLNELVAPELLQNDANAENIAKHIVELYKDKNRQQYMVKRFYELHQLLRQNASKNGAKAILDLINI